MEWGVGVGVIMRIVDFGLCTHGISPSTPRSSTIACPSLPSLRNTPPPTTTTATTDHGRDDLGGGEARPARRDRLQGTWDGIMVACVRACVRASALLCLRSTHMFNVVYILT